MRVRAFTRRHTCSDSSSASSVSSCSSEWSVAGTGPGWPGAGGHRRGFGPRAVRRRLLERLDTTPAQEKVFRDEAATLWEAARGLGGGLEASGRDLASALREKTLDRQKPESVYRRQDEIRRS